MESGMMGVGLFVRTLTQAFRPVVQLSGLLAGEPACLSMVKFGDGPTNRCMVMDG